MTKTSLDRQIQTLFPFALASLFAVGSIRLMLENMMNHQNSSSNLEPAFDRVKVNITSSDGLEEGCNVFDGRWVWDNVSYPLYKEESCSYLVKQVTCRKNGRRDSYYQNWRWQPNRCKLPTFDPMKLLEVLRGKRLMFIGDSIQRGQFESMVCLLQSVIPSVKKSLQRIPPRKIFKIEDFNVSIEYYWAPFIVESISDHATNHTVLKRLVKLDSIAKHGEHWKGVDVLVFESYVWWMHKPLINATYGFPDNVKEYNVTDAYKLALETWKDWLESSLNPDTQRVFFMSMSPTHLWSWEWNPGSDGNCFNETYPNHDPYWGTGSNRDIMNTVQDTLQKIKLDVNLLSITQLSEFRKDGHTSVYGERRGKLLTKEQRSDPKTYADCIHWCLPGVPDTWNEILYAYLLRDYLKSHQVKVQQKV